MLRIPVIRRSPHPTPSNRVPSRLGDCRTKAAGYRENASFLIDAEVSIDLPRRHVLDVIAPLFAFGRQKVLEEMIAERVAHQVVLLQLIERLVQISRELVDAKMAPFAMAHGEDVLVDRRAGIDMFFDAVE